MSLQDLFSHENKIVTKMGRSYLSQRVVYRGKDLHHQLSHMSWMELFAYGITGREFTPKEVKILNYIWVSTSYPDKSIWPNHITALAGTARTTPALALSAGIASCEAAIFGGKPFKVAIDFFKRANITIRDGDSLNDFLERELSRHRVIFGYGRPLASTDERVPHIIKFVKSLELDHLEHFNIAIDVANKLKDKKGLNMNVAAIYAALGADLGFDVESFHMFMTLCFVAGMPPCYIEAKEDVEGAFLPVRCDAVQYSGANARDW